MFDNVNGNWRNDMELIKLYSSLIQRIADQREGLDLQLDDKRIAYHAAACLLSDADLSKNEFNAMNEMILELTLKNQISSSNNEVIDFPVEPIANVFFLLSHDENDHFPPDSETIEFIKKEISVLRENPEQEYIDLAHSLLVQQKTEEELLGEFKKIDGLFEN